MAITLKDIQTLGDKLKKAPPPAPEERTLTKEQALAELKPTLEGMKAKGHTLEKIAQMLTEGGLKTSVNSVRALLGDQAAAAPKKKKKKAKTAAPKAPAKKAAAE